jgi:hypothetical protein
MGLLSFWKKKDSDMPAIQPLDAQTLPLDIPSDLPSIDGANFDDSNVQQFGGIKQPSQVKTQNAQIQTDSKSISFNVPTLDFSLPPADDIQANSSQSQTSSLNDSFNDASSSQSLPSLDALPPLDTSMSAMSIQQSQNTTLGKDQLKSASGNDVQKEHPAIEENVEEDLNKLFIKDSDWKEPDWSNFEPYPEDNDKIDEPKADDFKGSELPSFDDSLNASSAANSINSLASASISEPAEPFRKLQSDARPLELFIRGKAYNKVFIELDQMNKALTRMDNQASAYEELLKQQEPVLIAAKDQMEYLYRKTNQIDKKVFAQ